MVNITFDNKKSFDDYGLILSNKNITTPSTKTKTVEVLGGDGVLDVTEFFGEPKFKNRNLTFKFTKVLNNTEFNSFWSTLQNDFHGKKFKITLDEDPNFYYVGRISLSYASNKNIHAFTFACDCEPYKLKKNKTNYTIGGSGTANLKNLRMKTVPTITTTAETKLVFNNHEVNLSVGEFVVPELELSMGDNKIVVTSTGTTKFVYQEGGL